MAQSELSENNDRFDQFVRRATRSELYEFLRQMPKGGILHLHSEYAIPAAFWLKIATNRAVLQWNEYFAKIRQDSCSDGAGKRAMFVIIQRATRNQLPTCEQAAFTRLQSLSVDERNRLLRALQLIKPDRRGFFDGVVRRLDDLWQDPNLMLEVVPEIMKRAASEHVSYLELQLDPTSLHDAAGHAIPPDLFVERLKNRLAFPAHRTRSESP